MNGIKKCSNSLLSYILSSMFILRIILLLLHLVFRTAYDELHTMSNLFRSIVLELDRYKIGSSNGQVIIRWKNLTFNYIYWCHLQWSKNLHQNIDSLLLKEVSLQPSLTSNTPSSVPSNTFVVICFHNVQASNIIGKKPVIFTMHMK